MLNELYQKLEDRWIEMVNIRRFLHQHPELSFQEKNTAKYIADYYKEIGVPVQEHVGGNGVVARVEGALPGKTVALRADFDALPIQDEKEVEYRSTVPGVMHACGHDGHTATLLVLGKTLHEMRETLSGTVVLIHQHAEEYAPGGAKSMIEAGCLEDVDVIFGTHLWATEPLGKVLHRTGPIMAAADRFEIVIKGSGGHGAQPHKTKDSIVIGAQVVAELQQIVSRRVNPIDPAVVTVGSFIADNAFNVIADSAKLIGTVRTFNPEVRDFIEEEIEQILKGACLSGRCNYEFVYERGYPAVVNHPEETELFIQSADTVDEVHTVEEIEMQMGGEDFAFYLEHVKGTFFFTGAKPDNVETAYPHHHPKFDLNEKALLIAAKSLASATIHYQDKHSVSKAVPK
ncbi:amidohydrolase [Rossellomorea vietnamensis]|uniref:Amidohydrolase n=1 Tax=Rossellomorea vietnamensis TaxID=218284 RepID=A0A6I6UHB8_9BACI|nr:M20 family metallopeptidase [Rossellomorea vietnamensis]QHE60907.1 amidohydrolase [Rossellomorea vietnamensis]